MVSNLLKRWRDNFATVKRQRDSGLFEKKWDAIPPNPTPPQAMYIYRHTVDSQLSKSVGKYIFSDNPQNERKTRKCNKYISLFTDIHYLNSKRFTNNRKDFTVLRNYCNNFNK
jgi:hypothetical protein